METSRGVPPAGNAVLCGIYKDSFSRFWSFQACSRRYGSTKNLVPSSPSSIPVSYSSEPDLTQDTKPSYITKPDRTSSSLGRSAETTSFLNLDRRVDKKLARKAPVTNQDLKTVSRSRTVSPSCSGLRPCRTPGGKCCKPLGYQGRPSCRGVNNC